MNSDHTSSSSVDVPSVMTAQQRNSARFAYVLGVVQPQYYEGTVPHAEKQRRRAKNKAAKRARAISRRRA